MTTPPAPPKGYRRRKDGILEFAPTMHRDHVNEAVMGWHSGEKRLKCIERIHTEGSFQNRSCRNLPKHDPDWQGNPTKCGVHSEAAKAKRKAKSDARYAAWSAEYDRKAALRSLEVEALEIIRQIAEGHNDPRSLCAGWVKRRDEV